MCVARLPSVFMKRAAINAKAGIGAKRSAHPGGFVKHEIIDPLGLSVTRAAEVLGVMRARLSTLLNERARLSPEMAVRIKKAFGVSLDTLMRMQNSYDIAQARARASQINVAPFNAAAEPQAAGA
jgi:addiction module HigA family antidote